MEAGEPSNSGSPRKTKADKSWVPRIEALQFKTDHGMIVDTAGDWTNHGAAIPEPEWRRSPAANAPITHTRKETIEADATFSVPLATAATKSATVEGRSRVAGLSLKSSSAASMGPGAEASLPVKGTGALPDLVGRLKAAIAWRAKAGKYYGASSSGAHVVYVTYAKPIVSDPVDDGVTLRRMQKAIEWIGSAWASGKRKPVDLIESVFNRFSGYILGFEMLSLGQRRYLLANPAKLSKLMSSGFATYQDASQGGAWPLAEFANFGGECQAIVRLTKAIAHQVGLPGTFEIKYVSSEPADPYQSRILDDPFVDPDGPLPGFDYSLVDGPVVVGGEYGARDGVGFNRYEAFLKYTDGKATWFGGGIGRMPPRVKEKDLVRVFWGLAAVSAGGPDPAGGLKWRIEHVWRYR